MIKNNIKISRGYRLKPSTHKLIKSIEAITECDTDTILAKSCKLYLQSLKSMEQKEENNSQNRIVNLK